MSKPNYIQQSVDSCLLPGRLAPCAKAISILLLVLSSPTAWANDNDLPLQAVQLWDPQGRPLSAEQQRRWEEMHLASIADDSANQQTQTSPTDLMSAELAPHLSHFSKRAKEIKTEIVPVPMPTDIAAGIQLRRQKHLSSQHIDYVVDISNKIFGYEPPSNEPNDNTNKDTLTTETAAVNTKLARVLQPLISATEDNTGNDMFPETTKTNPRAAKNAQTTANNVNYVVNMGKKIFGNEPPPNEKINNDNLTTEAAAVSTELVSGIQPLISAATANILSTEKTQIKPKVAPKPPIKAKKVAPPVVPKPAPMLKPAPIIGHNPRVGSYIANQLATQQMFITDDLHLRLAGTRYIDPVTGEHKMSSMWLNTTGAKTRFHSGNDQLHTKSNRYAIQLGGALSTWRSGDNGQGLLGLTTGFGKSTNHSHSTSSSHQAQGSVDGYNFGLYSIWYADNHSKLGPYVDLLGQYGWFTNQVKSSQTVTGTNYRSYSLTTALETGYKAQLLDKANTRLFVQPKAKVLWQRTNGLDHSESNAPHLRVDESSGITTKLGIRTVLEIDVDSFSSTNTLQISPSFEANWIHRHVNQGAVLSNSYAMPKPFQHRVDLVSVDVTPQGYSNITDLKLGLEANINNNLQLWTHLGHQLGGHNYSDTQAALGAKYRF
ncbi:type V secretory pathway%2C adhesin AidA [Yersinia rohdei]|uniref:autotransporter outer membrane beta-barrel domain-containing protein n=1 Tax=Yersinia rohdei TaxID=29485 RepID=UPI00061BEDA2|nr:autotransporter outer membrane beta-barrel domain-containing protein [Yersinia rohdei]CNE60267.1 type V secretory pathway%2C adhesin AidA [Yersinia rohdei]